MKKRITIISIVIIIVVIIISIFKFYPFANRTYVSKQSDLKFEVPGMMVFKEECCMFVVSFKTFRSKNSLENTMNKILSKYEKIEDDTKRITYVDKMNKIQISNWGVERKILYNDLYIVYDKYIEEDIKNEIE